MSEEKRNQPPAELGAVIENNPSGTFVLALDSPTDERFADFPLACLFPDTLKGMQFHLQTLMKLLETLRDKLNEQKESVKKHAQEQNMTWEEYVQLRKQEIAKNVSWTDDAISWMENWKDENCLPECHQTVTQIQWIHLCRWTLYKKIELYYKEHENELRLQEHSKDQTPEDFSAFDADSESHIQYVREKHEEEEFLEKSAVLVFNRLGSSSLSERQIRSLSNAMKRMLESNQHQFIEHWTQEVIKTTREINDQSLAEVPSITLDDSKSNAGDNAEDITIPPTPDPSTASGAAEDLKNINLNRNSTPSGIPPLPKDSSTEDSSSIDKSEETGDYPTGEGTGDEATTPEDQEQRPKVYTHKSRQRNGDVVDDTE